MYKNLLGIVSFAVFADQLKRMFALDSNSLFVDVALRERQLTRKVNKWLSAGLAHPDQPL